MNPRLLDLFCGGGGASMGYYRAGFEIVGVDIAPQPNYPFDFIQADALDYLAVLGGYDDAPTLYHAIHASPPCQRWTIAQNARQRADQHPDLIAPLRPLLESTGLPYVIENVPGAPLRSDLVLCGTSFGLEAGGFEVRRHRIFESNVELGLSYPCQHRLPAMPIFGHNPNGDFYKRYGGGVSAELRKQSMGCEWMNRNELAEAIPPAFTEFIGTQLMAYLKVAA